MITLLDADISLRHFYTSVKSLISTLQIDSTQHQIFLTQILNV